MTPPTGPVDPAEVASRLDRVFDVVLAGAPPGVAEEVEGALSAVTRLYGAALARIVEAAGEETTRRLAADPAVAAVLVVHDLHPDSAETRVARALEEVRPYLGSHGGDVSMESVDPGEGTVTLRLLGSCDGCPSSATTMRLAVEKAIRAAAPEIDTIEVLDGGPAAVAGAPVRLVLPSGRTA